MTFCSVILPYASVYQVPDIYVEGYTSAFNAGMLVLRPDREVFKAMMTAMHAIPFPRYLRNV